MVCLQCLVWFTIKQLLANSLYKNNYLTNCRLYIVVLNSMLILVVAWLSGKALVSINEVTLRRARLVLGWVTVYERVNHLGM